jgi:hypothetical protein
MPPAPDSAALCDAGNGGQPACQDGYGAGRQNPGDLQPPQGTAGSASPER